MIHEEKKIGKIVEELTMYFFSIGADNVYSHIEKQGQQVIISFEGNYAPEYAENVQCLHKYLDEPKNEGMEDIYWELAGSGDPGEGSQLLLIGVMIDKAEILIEDNYVQLKLYKELME